ncbi:MAG: zinc-binding dehydrogenase [Dehalococcoidia bacterium]
MRAARLTGLRHFEFVEMEMPTLQDGQCLVRLERHSICGSDIRNVYGKLLPEESYPLLPGVPCHECAGTIVESRSDGLLPGQRVIVLPREHNGLSEYVVESPSRIIPVPSEGDLGDWLTCQPSGTVLYACKRLGSVLGRRVVVLGQGGIGLSFTMILSRLGAREVIVADLLDERLARARELGATHTINLRREMGTEVVAEMMGGAMADIVVEAAGVADAVNLALRLARWHGTVVLFGFSRVPQATLDIGLIMERQLSVVGSVSAQSGDPTGCISEMVQLVSRGWMQPATLITHRLPFDEVQRAYDMYEQRLDGVIKVMMAQ